MTREEARTRVIVKYVNGEGVLGDLFDAGASYAEAEYKAEIARLRTVLERFANVCDTCGHPSQSHDEEGYVDMMDEYGMLICGKPYYPAQEALGEVTK